MLHLCVVSFYNTSLWLVTIYNIAPCPTMQWCTKYFVKNFKNILCEPFI